MKTQDDVRTHHDEWIKGALGLWLAGLGDVVADARIAGRSRRGDVVYTERRDDPALRGRLGVRGELACGKVLFEVFRNALGALELKICVSKLIELETAEARAARRRQEKLSAIVVPTLCVVVPSMSREFRDAMGIKAVSADHLGVYTLLEEWRQSLPRAEELSEDVQEVAMNLGQSFTSWEDETLARGEAKGEAKGKVEGRAEGKAQGKAEAVLAVLDARGLRVTAAQRKQVLACTSGALLDAWLRAAVTTASVKALLSVGAPQRSRDARS